MCCFLSSNPAWCIAMNCCNRTVVLSVRPSGLDRTRSICLYVCLSVRPSINWTGPDWIRSNCLSVRPPIWAGPDRINLVDYRSHLVQFIQLAPRSQACEVKSWHKVLVLIARAVLPFMHTTRKRTRHGRTSVPSRSSPLPSM